VAALGIGEKLAQLFFSEKEQRQLPAVSVLFQVT
tara:strand:+ start:111 stop:212 length:102 start_codon:yes stop_codon:yes gene_type:complete